MQMAIPHELSSLTEEGCLAGNFDQFLKKYYRHRTMAEMLWTLKLLIAGRECCHAELSALCSLANNQHNPAWLADE